MIIIEDVTVQNFMSYGNIPTTFNLVAHVSTLMIGANGQGKSVISDALCFAFYGKPYRKIKVGQLVNSINRKASVATVNFKVDSTLYKVVRGQKPKIFEIWKDGVLVEEEAATRDYQKYLETQVLKIAYKTFIQLVVMGSSNFVPFMSLETPARRDVIEDVLDISLFSSMNEILKERVKTTKTESALIEVQLDSAKKETASQKRVIAILQEATDSRVAEETAEIERIEQLRTDVETQRERLNKMYAKFPAAPEFDPEALSTKTRSLSIVEHDIKNLTGKITSIHSLQDCPTCMQVVADDHKEKISTVLGGQCSVLEETKHADELLIEKMREMKAAFERHSGLVSKYNSELERLNSSIIAYGRDIESHQNNILKVGSDKGNITEEKERLNVIVDSALKIIQRRNELLEEKSMQDISGLLLKDSGIKASIIKEYIPVLNKLLNRYLSAFGFDVNFHLDENFNETVLSRGRDEFTYNSFSEGEKRKIDVAILLAFRRVTEMKNSATCNLLVMDEIVDSSLDPASREIFLDILAAEGGNNFVISHTTPSMDVFDAVIEFKKVGNFSTYEYLS